MLRLSQTNTVQLRGLDVEKISYFGKVLLLHLSNGPRRVFIHKWSEGEVDKRRDKGSLTEARRINQVQADKEIETGNRKDRRLSPTIGPVCGLSANLDGAITALFW